MMVWQPLDGACMLGTDWQQTVTSLLEEPQSLFGGDWHITAPEGELDGNLPQAGGAHPHHGVGREDAFAGTCAKSGAVGQRP